MTLPFIAKLRVTVGSPDEPLVTRVFSVLHFVSLIVSGVFLVWINRNQWFFGDEWDFLVQRGVLGAEYHLFQPHNEHWSTVPILIYRALFALFGVRTYVPYVVVLIAFHVAAVHLLWRVLRRVGASAPVATAVATLFSVYGGGFENLLWAFQIGFIGSVGLGLVAVLLVDERSPSPRRKTAAVAVTVLGLTFSGVTVTMTAVAALLVLLRRGIGAALRFVVIPAVVYGSWYAVFGRKAVAQAPMDVDSLLLIPHYVAEGVFGALEVPTGMEGAGPVLALGLAAWLIHQRTVTATVGAPAVALAAGIIFLFLSTGITRSALGVEQATSSRYVYLAGALVLPAVGLVLSRASAGRWLSTGFVLVLVSLATVHGLGILRTLSRAEGDRELAIKRRVLASADLIRTGAPVVDLTPEPMLNPDLGVDELRTLDANDKLPRNERVEVYDRLGAQTFLQVAVVDVNDPRPRAAQTARLVSVVDGVVEEEMDGCFRVRPTGSTPQLVLDVVMAASFELKPGGPSSLQILLRPAPPDGTVGPPRSIALDGQPVVVTIAASRTSPLVHVPDAAAVFCGLVRQRGG